MNPADCASDSGCNPVQSEERKENPPDSEIGPVPPEPNVRRGPPKLTFDKYKLSYFTNNIVWQDYADHPDKLKNAEYLWLHYKLEKYIHDKTAICDRVTELIEELTKNKDCMCRFRDGRINPDYEHTVDKIVEGLREIIRRIS